MRNYRTIDDIVVEYFRKHPDEVVDYITELFEEYSQDGDIAALLFFLRIVGRVKCVSFVLIRKCKQIFPW